MNNPSLFIATNELPRGLLEEFTVDLSKIVLVSRRSEGLGYWLNLGAASIPMSQGIGDKVVPAWIAFAGKFDPSKMR